MLAGDIVTKGTHKSSQEAKILQLPVVGIFTNYLQIYNAKSWNSWTSQRRKINSI